MTATLIAALGYAARGWDVFPAPPGEKKSCKSAEYSNGAKWGKTRDPEQIRRDFQRWPNANVGIPTGADAGFWVVELDTPKGHAVDGIASLHMLEEKHGKLPPTLMAASPSGSLHHYFKWPDAVVIKNSASGIGPGIDVRGEGGMVIAPPSVRGDGDYRWLNDNPIADAPQWLIDAAVAASKGNSKGADGAAEDPQASIERIRAAFAVIPNEKRGWDDWNRCGLALYHATAGSDDGLAVFHAWSSKSKKYDAQATTDRWAHHKTCPPTEIGAGSIFHWADEASPSWEMLVGMPLEKAMKIAELVTLSTYEYENQRKAVAEEMGMRASVLDNMVDRLRPRGADADDDGKQGRAISFPEPEPWPERVDGAALLDGIAEALGRHVVMTEHARHAAALWIVHTYLLDGFMISPRLAVRSPMKRCGKTTLLDALDRVVLKPLPTANVTAAALFRVVEGYRPTLLVDEADTFLAEADELRGVLNSGHRRGGSVLRTVGDDHEPRAFGTYAAVAIAVIGNLPDTLADRSVTIDLKRRLASERVELLRLDRTSHLDVLARRAARWAADNAVQIAAADPEMPAGIHSREADNWRPLIAIATAAGGEWLERAKAAALSAHAATGGDEASMIELLLGDIRDTFAKRAANVVDPVGRIPSGDLVEALVAAEGRPWAELGKSRKPLTANGLARRLRPLAITPDTIRLDEKRTIKGYHLHQFKEAFARYLGAEGEAEPSQRNKADETGTSEPCPTVTAESDVTVGKCKKPNNDGPCYGVTDGKGESEQNEYAEGGNGLASGLSQRTILDFARWYLEQADAQRQGGADVVSTELDSGLRQVLSEQVLPEFVEVEFERVMAEVFRV